jgi:hypothetical protein
MPIKTGGGLVKVSYVITQRQYDRLEALHQSRKTEGAVIKKTDIAREVIEAGLNVILTGDITGSTAQAEEQAA